MPITKFAFPTTIHFGAGARRLAGPHLREMGLKRPLIVTDRGLAALPLVAELQAELAAAGLAVDVYGGVFGNPTGSQVMGGAAAYRAHSADCVVGVGGGAALDVAKVVGLLATHPGDVMEYVWDHPQARPVTAALPYFVALPTTSGTGSEVGRSSVMTYVDMSRTDEPGTAYAQGSAKVVLIDTVRQKSAPLTEAMREAVRQPWRDG